MEKKLWFKAKQYGYGWYPVTWQGWGVLGLYVIGLFVAIYAIQNPLLFVVHIAILTTFLIVVCVAKGEGAKWRWGKSIKIDEN
jgi:hypothetical protein